MFDANQEFSKLGTTAADCGERLTAETHDWGNQHPFLAGAAATLLTMGLCAGAVSVLRKLASSESAWSFLSTPASEGRVNLMLDRQQELVRLAQSEAGLAVQQGNSPFGAVLIDKVGNVLAQAHNTQSSAVDATGHAEINLLRDASKLMGTKSFAGLDLAIVGNAEPCSMCSSAAIKSGIRNFYYGAPHEPSMEPRLGIAAVARASKQPVYFTGRILEDSSKQQISLARAAARREQDSVASRLSSADVPTSTQS